MNGERKLKVDVDADGTILKIDHDGQGFSALDGVYAMRSYWACGHCGLATGGSQMSCPEHPEAVRFMKHDRVALDGSAA